MNEEEDYIEEDEEEEMGPPPPLSPEDEDLDQAPMEEEEPEEELEEGAEEEEEPEIPEIPKDSEEFPDEALDGVDFEDDAADDNEDELLDIERVMVHVNNLVQGSIEHTDQEAETRGKAMEYYNGVMTDMIPAKGMSGVQSSVIRDTIKKIMPSIMRTLLSNNRIVEYEPNTAEQTEQSNQATNYVNLVVLRECDAEKAIYSAIMDAMIVKTGIIKWTAYRDQKVEKWKYTEVMDDALDDLENDPEVEIEDLTSATSTDKDVLALNPDTQVHSFTARRVKKRIIPRLEAVKRENFFIDPMADNILEAEVVGQRLLIPRSDLVGMGYPKDLVWDIEALNWNDSEFDRHARMGYDEWTEDSLIHSKAMEVVEVYEAYVKLDMDNDGIAEIYRVLYGKGQSNGDVEDGFVKLVFEEVSEAPYAAIRIEPEPHQFEGRSLFEDMKNVQQILTVLMRGLVNTTYDQADTRVAYNMAAVQNPQDISNPRMPIAMKAGKSVQEAIQFVQRPYIGEAIIPALQFIKQEQKERTGITDASGGVTPEAMQNQSATAAALVAEAGAAQADSIIRSIASGLRVAFVGLLQLVIQHADRPRTVRVSGEFVEYDPRAWDADMECIVNIGLGGGTKERDLASLQMIKELQTEIHDTLGEENPYVNAEQVYNTIQKMVETTGLPSADPFFTRPDMEALEEEKANAEPEPPDPEIEIKQQKLEIEKLKAENDMMIAQQKMQLEQNIAMGKGQIAVAELKGRQGNIAMEAQGMQLKHDAIQADMREKGTTARIQQQKLQQDMFMQEKKGQQELALQMQQQAGRERLESLQMKADNEHARHKTLLEHESRMLQMQQKHQMEEQPEVAEEILEGLMRYEGY